MSRHSLVENILQRFNQSKETQITRRNFLEKSGKLGTLAAAAGFGADILADIELSPTSGTIYTITGKVVNNRSSAQLDGLKAILTDEDGIQHESTISNGEFTIDIVTSIEETANNTNIRIPFGLYGIKAKGAGVQIEVHNPGNKPIRPVQIVNILGQTIKTIKPERPDLVHWDGTNNAGNRIGSGIYLARIFTDSHITNARMVFSGGKFTGRGKISTLVRRDGTTISVTKQSLKKSTAVPTLIIQGLQEGFDEMYTYENLEITAGQNDLGDIPMINKYVDPDTGMDVLHAMKFLTTTDGLGENTTIERWLVKEQGQILYYMGDAGTVSALFNTSIREAFQAWEDSINEHLPLDKQMTFFQEVDFDPTEENIDTSTEWSLTGAGANCAGGINVTYDGNTSAEWKPKSELWSDSTEYGSHIVYGNMQFTKALDGFLGMYLETFKALSEHVVGHALGLTENFDTNTTGVMNVRNSSKTPPMHISKAEARLTAEIYINKNMLEMKYYSETDV